MTPQTFRREAETLTQTIGREVFDRVEGARPNVFQSLWWQERLLRFFMQSEWLKVQAFRFIDALPTLGSDAEIARHLREYLVHPRIAAKSPPSEPCRWHGGRRANGECRIANGNGRTGRRRSGIGGAAHAINAATEREAALRELSGEPGQKLVDFVSRWMNFHCDRCLRAGLTARIARTAALGMARSFIAGSNMREAVAAITRLREQRLTFTLDVLGEAALSRKEAEHYHAVYMEVLDALPDFAGNWPLVRQVDEADGAPLPRVNVSVKLTSIHPGFDPIAPQAAKARAKELLRPLLRKAMHRGSHLHVDMEHHAIKDLTLEMFRELVMEAEFRDYPHFGIVLQAYLKDADRDVAQMIEFARRRGTPLWIRLVKGAYWDSELVWSQQAHWPLPVWEQKWMSDACYERVSRMLLENHNVVSTAFASHNVRSLSHAMALRRLLDVPGARFELQMLYGMGDPIKRALVQMGQRCRIYTPYGEILPGMAYFIRRLLENTSNESFLRHSFSEGAAVGELLRDPEQSGAAAEALQEPFIVRFEFEEPVVDPFDNVACSDFSQESARRQMSTALQRLRAEPARSFPLMIGGEPTQTGQWFDSLNPSRPAEIVARIALADRAAADRAVAAARAACEDWRETPAMARAELLERVAGEMNRRRFELAALMTLECGKPWREADADVSEAVDFCNYYAKDMRRMAGNVRRRDIAGETNLYVYTPRGVALVLSPWDFPLALLSGMTAAAIVTGNTVVMKPARAAGATAFRLYEMFRDAGLPAGVLSYLPAEGATVGDYLVRHPGIDLVALTGSRDVGTRVYRAAAESPTTSGGFKKVILDLGGKNAIIIDADADLDEAIKGVIASAFSHAGQKCTAASRVIVLEGVHGRFMDRLVESVRGLSVGPADEPGTFVPPVIDAAAQRTIREAISRGRQEATCVLETDASALASATGGFYVGPAIFDDVPAGSRLAQEEIFGPVLAVMKATHIEHAIELFNATPYALCGGIYSRSPANIEQARAECRCGTFYINRRITGSRVDLQPFGGFGASGLGARAGGPDYLVQFCEPRTICESTLRRGFAPSEDVVEALG
ncbi:1-pyrroline-5-carboxylate dehydrogenase 1 [Phycisphaerae bacterium RAS1]|nr:1-pyrroline-5-carboxylate dehydrogenase 1 [Phycisphaerae bacterium RAS1]